MRIRFRLIVLTAGLSALAAGSARADMTVYYHAGNWDAFSGAGDNGQPVCGMGTRNPGDGSTFSMRFQYGADGVTFVASKPGWSIPDGTQITVVAQVGLDRPWLEQAMGSGQRVQWTLDRTAVQDFDEQFRRASSMTVTFPSGNEQPWVLGLEGSTAVSNTMGRCVTGMASRAPAPAQASAPGTEEEGEHETQSQPFGAAPATANAAPGTVDPTPGTANAAPGSLNAAPARPTLPAGADQAPTPLTVPR